MVGFGTLMIIFGGLIILAGLYTFTGHYSDILLWKTHMKDRSKEYLSYLGKVIMCVGLTPVISGAIAMAMPEDSAIPLIVLLVSFIAVLVISIKMFKVKDNGNKESENIKE